MKASPKTKRNLSATPGQLALKAKHKLTNKQFGEMLEMLTLLTPFERRLLGNPDFITEDEADVIVSNRRLKEPGRRIPAEEIFAEFGYTPRSRRGA